MFPWSLKIYANMEIYGKKYGNMRVMQVARLLQVVSCETLRGVASHCKLLRVTAIYLSLGISPTFVTIALLLPADYSINASVNFKHQHPPRADPWGVF